MKDGIPIEYTLQVSLYGYLLGVENVMIIVSFLEENDYKNPDDFKPSSENTMIYHFNIYEQHPDFKELLQEAENWWKQYIPTGISPKYLEKDNELVQELKERCFIDPDVTLQGILQPYEEILTKMEQIEQSELYKQYQQLQKEKSKQKKILEKYFLKNQKESKTKYDFEGENYKYESRFVENRIINKELLKQDGLLEKYTKSVSTTFKVQPKRKKKNE